MLEQFDIKKDSETLERFSIDASIFRMMPKGVFVPKSKDEVIKFVNQVIKIKKENPAENISLTSRSAGTCMSGGSLTHEYVISFTEHLNNIIKIDKTDMSVEVQPGVYYRDMEKETLKQGLIYPSYPASRELCALGGMVGNNAAGEKTFKYGKTDKYIEEVEMVCADGNIYNFRELVGEELDDVLQNDKTFYGDMHRAVLDIINNNQNEIEKNRPRVTKNSSGYYLWKVYDRDRHAMNLAKLICGAQGTLGVMTNFKLKLVEAEEKSKMAVVFLKDIQDMPILVERISPLLPESFEVFDDHTFRIAMKFLPQIVKRLGGSILAWRDFFGQSSKCSSRAMCQR